MLDTLYSKVYVKELLDTGYCLHWDKGYTDTGYWILCTVG